MMKRLLALLLSALVLVACDDKNTYEEPVAPQQTLLMYFPWSGNDSGSTGLLSHFLTNIDDMEEAIRYNAPEGCRVLVYLVERKVETGIGGATNTYFEGSLQELKARGGKVERVQLTSYRDPDMTEAEQIARLLKDVQAYAPAPRYAMTIGCHGMGWIPATATKAVSREGAEREYWEYEGVEQTRWFGGMTAEFQTEIPTLAEAIRRAGMKMEYILFDDCYMSSVEVAYELKDVTDYLIGSTSEIMAEGFPYTEIGALLLGEVDYEGICESFYQYYMERSSYPCGTVAVTVCRELEALAEVMKRINAASEELTASELSQVQVLDGYDPCRFYDLGDYVNFYCKDAALRGEFERQLERTVPAAFRRHTPTFYSMTSGETDINAFSGITTSDPSLSPLVVDVKGSTAWWKATH
ncbi:MAG: Clostripain family protein [Rikenellaceae bacterium]|nr:Clostripain family protein [Rikenellaceae bacterium]